jgi:hypothetical protein
MCIRDSPFYGTEAVQFDETGCIEVEEELGNKLIVAVEEVLLDGIESVVEVEEKVEEKIEEVVWNELPEGLSDEVIEYVGKLKNMSHEALSELVVQMPEPPKDWKKLSHHDLAEELIAVVTAPPIVEEVPEEVKEVPEEIPADVLEEVEEVPEKKVEEAPIVKKLTKAQIKKAEKAKAAAEKADQGPVIVESTEEVKDAEADA